MKSKFVGVQYSMREELFYSGLQLNLLVFIVPDSNGLIHGTSGYNGFSDTHIHPCDLSMVVGVGEIVKCCTASLWMGGKQ